MLTFTEETRKRQLLDTAKLLGNEKPKSMEEILARSRISDETLETLKRLTENPNPQPRNNSIKIVQREEALM